MELQPDPLLLLCHQGDWEHRYQASAAAAAAATSAREVRIVFFFRALELWVEGEWGRPAEAGNAYRGRELADHVEEAGQATPDQLLAVARRSGRCRLFACSASVALIGRRAEELADAVDEIVGWPTIVQWMRPPAQVLYL